MDRLTHSQVGGPYASRDDATRAIEAGGFDQSSAELTVMENDPEADDGSKEAVRKQAKDEFPPKPEQPAEPEPPGDGVQPDNVPDMEQKQDPMVPGTEDPADEGGFDPEAEFGEEQAADPFAAGQMPLTTKPSQMPSGGGGDGMDTGIPGEEPETDEGSADPVASTIDSVAAVVRRNNPEADEASIRRVARKATARLIAEGFDGGLIPNIEDPLAHRPPFAGNVKKVKKDVQRARQRLDRPSAPDDLPQPTQPTGPSGPSSLPDLPDLDFDTRPEPVEPVDLSDYDRRRRHAAMNGLIPDIEDPLAGKTPFGTDADKDDKDKNADPEPEEGSSLPFLPNLPGKAPEAGRAAGGAAAAGGEAAAASELPLMLV